MTITIPVWLCWTLGVVAGLLGLALIALVLLLAVIGYGVMIGGWQ